MSDPIQSPARPYNPDRPIATEHHTARLFEASIAVSDTLRPPDEDASTRTTARCVSAVPIGVLKG